MKVFGRLMALFGFGMLLASAQTLAAPNDAVFNKEHVWVIDVDHGACAISRKLEDGSTFLFRAMEGDLTFGYFSKTPLQKGRAGRIETDSDSFDFQPSYGDEGETLFLDSDLSAQAVAVLRRAQNVKVIVDGKLVVAMTFAGTGAESALDGGLACSKGARGWWGEGVKPAPTRPPGGES